MTPLRSYIICCTPRCGSHLFADGLTSTGIAGYPVERFPRQPEGVKLTAAQADAMVTEAPPESWYDSDLDREYIRHIIETGTTGNGTFAVTVHWFQVNDAVRRIRDYLRAAGSEPHQIFSRAFPKLSYVWLRRRDKVAQAVSWYKAIQTGRYVRLRDAPDARSAGEREVAFDYSKIRMYWAALRSYDNGWNHFFTANGLRPFVVHYEDLCNDYERSIRDVLSFLALSHQDVCIKVPRFEKTADIRSFEWIARFKSMNAVTKRSPTG
jgi:LPS sulfotransferase NodH